MKETASPIGPQKSESMKNAHDSGHRLLCPFYVEYQNGPEAISHTVNCRSDSSTQFNQRRSRFAIGSCLGDGGVGRFAEGLCHGQIVE